MMKKKNKVKKFQTQKFLLDSSNLELEHKYFLEKIKIFYESSEKRIKNYINFKLIYNSKNLLTVLKNLKYNDYHIKNISLLSSSTIVENNNNYLKIKIDFFPHIKRDIINHFNLLIKNICETSKLNLKISKFDNCLVILFKLPLISKENINIQMKLLKIIYNDLVKKFSLLYTENKKNIVKKYSLEKQYLSNFSDIDSSNLKTMRKYRKEFEIFFNKIINNIN